LNFPCPWISYVPNFLRNISKVCEFKYESLRVLQVCILPWNLNMIFFIYISLVLQIETAASCVFTRLFIYIGLFYFLAQKAHQLLLLYSVDYFQCPRLALYFLAEVWFMIYCASWIIFSFSLIVKVCKCMPLVLMFSRTHAEDFTDTLIHFSSVCFGM
jgi:hypothetical protein